MTAPNILLVVLDSVRASNCGLYGHDNETTPFLSEFADEATVFEQARAPGIHSVASHASIFSGYHVEEHRLTEHESYLAPSASVWHDLGAERGYETGIFSSNTPVTEASNLAEPFGTVVGRDRQPDDRRYDEGLWPRDLEGHPSRLDYLRAAVRHPHPVASIANWIDYHHLPDRPPQPENEASDVYVDDLLEWIRERSGPWAACLNLMDAHYEYVPKPDHDLWGGDLITAVRDGIPGKPDHWLYTKDRPVGEKRATESLYDGCIHQADALVEHLVTTLDRRGELDDTLVVITSDHGEGFCERSRLTPAVRIVDHVRGIHEKLTHVPLLVKEPGQHAGGRVGEPASLTRFPAVVGAALRGEGAAEEFVPDGDVVASTFRLTPPADYLPIPEAEREPYFGPWRAVYRQEDGRVFKYAAHGDDAATFRIRDAQTVYRVADDDDGVVDRVFGRMEPADVEVGDSGRRDLDDAVHDRLQELGYVG